MKPNRRSHSQAGFSILEVFIASMMLAIALFGISLLSIGAAKNNRMAAVGVWAVRVGTDVLSDFQAMGYDDLAAQGGLGGPVVGSPAGTMGAVWTPPTSPYSDSAGHKVSV